MFTTRFEDWVRRHAEALMKALGRLPVTPNQITVVGTLLTFVVAALAGSFLVSYVRARAQSLGFTCETGLFARPERVVALVVGLIFGGVVLAGVVFLLAILTNLTALQRIREVWLQGRAQRLAREREAATAPASGQPVKP